MCVSISSLDFFFINFKGKKKSNINCPRQMKSFDIIIIYFGGFNYIFFSLQLESSDFSFSSLSY